MKRIVLISFMAISILAVQGQVKDSLFLGCPMKQGIMKMPPKEGFGYKGDLKMIVQSASDSLLLSPADGKIDLISMGEGGKLDLVMHHKGYNIWLVGLSRCLVKKNEVVKKGQVIGNIKAGEEIEFLLFNDEEPIDAGKYLDCKM